MSAQIKLKLFQSRRNSLFFTRGRHASYLYVHACLDTTLLLHFYYYPKNLEDTDSDGRQLCSDKEISLQRHNQFWQSLEEDARQPTAMLRLRVCYYTLHGQHTGYDNNFFLTCPVGQVDVFSTCPSGKTSCPCQILKINHFDYNRWYVCQMDFEG